MEEDMSAGEYCNREVVVIARSESVREAVTLMRQFHVGTIVIVEAEGDNPVPLGILTDRDIVIEVLAKNVDLSAVNVGDLINDQLVTVDEDTKLLDAIELMRIKGVRRLPVVNKTGGLAGILTLDDVMGLLAEELGNIAQLVNNEQRREQNRRA
jgi:CBS domain-containing protein